MSASLPRVGDLIVRCRPRNHDFSISIRGASASQETYCATRDDALTLATRAARPLRADVWETNDGVTFDRVVGYGG